MSAYLDFVPSQVLLEWNDELILKTLADAGVKKGYKQYQFSRIYDKLKDCEESDSFLIATGLEPKSSQFSRYNILVKGMPKSYETAYESASSENPKPEVHLVIDDYFLDDESVQKPLVVLKYFYVDKDERVIEIDLDSKPKDGFTVTGKILSPPQEESFVFCLSRNLKIDKNTGFVTASESGFIRIGKDWMDLVPFHGHSMSITNSDDFAEYYLTFKPGTSDSPIPTYEDIIELFEDIDYPLEKLRSEVVINSFIKKSVDAKKPIKFSLTEPLKSVMRIDVNPSKTRATLVLKKGAGPGEKLSLKKIGSLIRESKIKGMNLDSVKKQILTFYKKQRFKYGVSDT